MDSLSTHRPENVPHYLDLYIFSNILRVIKFFFSKSMKMTQTWKIWMLSWLWRLLWIQMQTNQERNAYSKEYERNIIVLWFLLVFLSNFMLSSERWGALSLKDWLMRHYLRNLRYFLANLIFHLQSEYFKDLLQSADLKGKASNRSHENYVKLLEHFCSNDEIKRYKVQ